MTLRVDEARFEESGRLAGIAIATYTLRAMERWRANLTDYDCVMIMIAVIAISAGKMLRSGIPADYQSLSKPVERAMLSKVNISSIAHATGLNRETARRKINDLVEQGLLTRFADGSVGFAPGLVQQGGIRDQIRGQLGEVATLANQLIKFGLIADAGPKPRPVPRTRVG